MADRVTYAATIPADLMVQLESLARQQGRPAADLIADAVRSYLDDRRWENLLGAASQRARAMGLSEDDAPALIAESRSEQAAGHSVGWLKIGSELAALGRKLGGVRLNIRRDSAPTSTPAFD